MAEYSISLVSSAAKELEHLPKKIVPKIINAIEELAITPRPHGCKKLKGGDKEHRIRIADYRVIYEINDKIKSIVVTCIAHRREVYRI